MRTIDDRSRFPDSILGLELRLAIIDPRHSGCATLFALPRDFAAQACCEHWRFNLYDAASIVLEAPSARREERRVSLKLLGIGLIGPASFQPILAEQ